MENITPIIGEVMRGIMIPGETRTTHLLLEVITTEKSHNHRILDHKGEEMGLMDHGQVLLVLVRAGGDLLHSFRARMEENILGALERLLFVGILNLLIQDKSRTHRILVVVRVTVVLPKQSNAYDVGGPIMQVFVKNMIGGKDLRATNVAGCMILGYTGGVPSHLDQGTLILDNEK